ncbi:carbamoyl phosphate synthase large subunit, partial [Liberibacter sp. Z1]|nr:carbamoyl phosphate synthase large subunit [Candidatus Liberibacter sp.]
DYLLEVLPELVSEEIKRRYPNDKTGQINTLLGRNPLLFDSYLTDAMEIDVDALCQDNQVIIVGIMEHIEEAGIHSGDSACSLPPRSLSKELIDELIHQTTALAQALNVGGLINVQYAIKDGKVYVLEANPRASRTIPFVAKAIGFPIAKVASRIIAGESLDDATKAYGGKPDLRKIKHFAVKESVFPFSRFLGIDILLGPEMRSTGEVIGIDRDFPIAFAKSQLGTGVDLPRGGSVFVSVRDADKKRIVPTIRLLKDLGFKILATGGTARFLSTHGLETKKINKVLEGRPHIEDAISNRQVHLVINTTEGNKAIEDSKSLRRTTLLRKIPYYTTISGAEAAAQAIQALKAGSLEVYSLQSYFVDY